MVEKSKILKIVDIDCWIFLHDSAFPEGWLKCLIVLLLALSSCSSEVGSSEPFVTCWDI